MFVLLAKVKVWKVVFAYFNFQFLGNVSSNDLLLDIAEQNYGRYRINYKGTIRKGMLLLLNNTENIGITLTRFFTAFLKSTKMESKSQISLPIWDSYMKGMISFILIIY